MPSCVQATGGLVASNLPERSATAFGPSYTWPTVKTSTSHMKRCCTTRALSYHVIPPYALGIRVPEVAGLAPLGHEERHEVHALFTV